MRDILPPQVYESIARHLRAQARYTKANWEVNAANEDSLCGAAFSQLQTRRKRHIYVDGQEWVWRVSARKFGSGGIDSEEKETGADGIVEVEVRHPDGRTELKGLLIQAKKEWTGADSRLRGQVQDMEDLRVGISAALDFTPSRVTGVDGRAVLKAEGNRRAIADDDAMSFGDYLADRFLACAVGLRGVQYDANRRVLYLPRAPGAPDAVRLRVFNRLRIEVVDEGRPPLA